MITQTTLPDGTLTERLYKLVGEQQFHGAVALLMDLLHSRSNPADQKLCYSLLPILGYCLYMAEDFEAAGEVYNQLFEVFPAVGEYQHGARRVHLHQSRQHCLNQQPFIEAGALKKVVEWLLQRMLKMDGVAAANLCCAVDILQGRLRTANEHLLLLSSSTATTKAALGTDYVTLHNQALSLATTDPTESIRILASLLDERFAPKTTVANLLILYCKYGHFEAAEKLAASFGEVNLGDLNECETEFLRNFMLEISATCCTTSVVERSASTALQEYIDTLIPVLVTLAESYIADGKLSKAEALLGSYGSMCGDSNYWKINMGHILFMQKKYDKCLSFYEDGVRTDVCGRALQGWEVVALTNALAANILLGHIDQAQQLLNLLNASEQLDVRNASTASGWNDSIPHSSVAKLIVGTLYCAEKAYDYGVRSVLEALDPMERALNVNTWGHCKACIGSLLTDVALGNFILDYELKRNIAAVLLRIEAKARSLPCIGVGEYEMKCPQRPTKGLVGAVRTAVPMFVEIVAVEYHIESNAVERLVDDEIKTS
ncbi:Tetratricopeptide repeat protein, related [Eimeria mitis]|uniref:Tetratricopeptide repeat protein, related n=1 Tax=Eimeria mitis TaxID=44415 RepID=U6JV52_9EIME|nr:Tetratricopeptide repeat protein, related [Eimeria mitis]CDJ27932.1 Tetratricopeptide repeat protein, related [Eimeria mitis]